ncbi:uncharacterized protein RSE6_04628 [Rhynchosporium secalis]|uniref:alpha-1,2-Mannosidase n=1 Tax=Rhynchosporium secalis TaxID=38038 RepID=A0A1E1M5T3_RHYSE|nr:uncharacterized protein RSE6_04628 [Rhynchosporium secalis]
MYQSALATFSKRLFFRPSLPQNPDILMSGNIETSIDPNVIDGQFQHLACFVGGMVALGSRISNSAEELETAAKLTNGCVWGYDNTPSGIMPDFSHIKPCQDPAQCVWEGSGNGFVSVDDPSYQLRPEAIESVFIMYRLTADPIWMEKGWKMFQAVQKHTKTSIANARVVDVMEKWPKHEDSMESYWLAETLKYFYLLFSKPDLVSLDDLENLPCRALSHALSLKQRFMLEQLTAQGSGKIQDGTLTYLNSSKYPSDYDDNTFPSQVQNRQQLRVGFKC